MTRTAAREIAVHFSFELGFNNLSAGELLESHLKNDYFESLSDEDELYSSYPDEKQTDYLQKLIDGVDKHLAELDEYIERYSVGWKFGRISRVAAAIMRNAMFEILYIPDIPNSVAINEAVEICKKYEQPDVAAFINGILGAFVRNEVV